MTATATKKKKSTKKESLPTKIRDWEKPIPFTETFKWDDLSSYNLTTFTANSYTEWMGETLPIINSMGIGNKKGTKVGDWLFYLKPLPLFYWGSPFASFGFGFGGMGAKQHAMRSTLAVYRGETPRNVCFDAVVNIPVLADKYLHPWMSLTPNEIFTLRGSIRRAKKDTAIAGLGMGWVARKVLERKQVKHLTIYERSQDLIDFFGNPLVEDFGDRVSLVCCDAYDAPWMNHDVALWDIWQGFGEAGWDRKYRKIRDEMRDADKVCIGWGEGVHRSAY